MKLKTFNHETLKTVRGGKATIRFTRQGGITISGKAAEKLNLSDGSKIEFCQSQEDPRDWYIHKTTSESGFEIRKSKAGICLMFNSSKLTAKFFESIETLHKSVGFIVSGMPEVINGENYYYILTGNPIIK